MYVIGAFWGDSVLSGFFGDTITPTDYYTAGDGSQCNIIDVYIILQLWVSVLILEKHLVLEFLKLIIHGVLAKVTVLYTTSLLLRTYQSYRRWWPI